MASTVNFVILLMLAVGAVSVVNGSRIIPENGLLELRSNDLIVGNRQSNDRLVYQETLKKSASFVGQKVIHEQIFYALRDYVITQVRALDLGENGKGASVEVTGGGPGFNSVTLRFKSQRFHGIHFIVQVFAKLK